MAELASQQEQTRTPDVYTNIDHDPDATRPWNQRNHYRVRSHDEVPSDGDQTNIHSPLPQELPLSPPPRRTTHSHVFYDGTTSVYGSAVREQNDDSDFSID